jgi:hypothetical protein
MRVDPRGPPGVDVIPRLEALLPNPISTQGEKKVLTKEGGTSNRACTAEIKLTTNTDVSRNKYQRRNESEG